MLGFCDVFICKILWSQKIMAEEKFHEIALFWCDENEVEKYKTLEEYDRYFKELYENWR